MEVRKEKKMSTNDLCNTSHGCAFHWHCVSCSLHCTSSPLGLLCFTRKARE